VVDSAALWSATGGVDVEDFTFGAVRADPEVPIATRLRWLRSVQPDFTPGPYEQLAAVYRNGGDEVRAEQVQLEKQRRRHAELRLAGRIWGRLQEWTVGYGYRPWLALAWLVVFWVAGGLWFSAHRLPRLDSGQDPAWNPWLVSADLLLPIVNLGADGMWRYQGAGQWISGLLVAVGWILASTAAAGAARILKRG
jgi:hypothetical protein